MRRRSVLGLLAAAAPLARAGVAQAQPRAADDFAFAFIGDTPYFELEKLRLEAILRQWDASLAFAVHIGDIKASWERCDDSLYAERERLLDASPIPLVYVPGDNEWTDCRSEEGGGYDPFERLNALRRLFHSGPTSIGRVRMPVQRQSEVEPGTPFAENQRWRHGDALFVTIDLPGGLKRRPAYPGWSAPWSRQRAANERWLRRAVADANRERLPLLVIAMHADPLFEKDEPHSIARVTPPFDEAYGPFRALLRELSHEFHGQVVLLHGDTHRFRTDQPLRDASGRTIENFTRVECFGSPFGSSWVRIQVQAHRTPPFLVAVRHLPEATPN